ncbi:tetratricopeptide repeat protein [Dyella tabacisoli]|uniref:Tetratricopeptide repeat protein n=1 Tax=Dyella tabacisoli TaxID=2282381 RepID=A0A369UR37_9GAMM|nr:tetratricopeptide repeat protein [Dyella tabacisoli]RDD82198.1 tetratricopeptide repeat protein [Dyella tabacisoli]
MNATLIDNLRAQCHGPRDGALLRFALGQALLSAGDVGAAATELQRALDFDPHYSAAWKLLGKARLASDDTAGAKTAWQHGIEAAQRHGDKQAEKEMAVFLRRLP